MNTGRNDLGAFGSSAIDGTAAGGYLSGAITSAESFNGTTWLYIASMNTARYLLGAFGSSAIDGTVAGGYGGIASAERYSGGVYKWEYVQ